MQAVLSIEQVALSSALDENPLICMISDFEISCCLKPAPFILFIGGEVFVESVDFIPDKVMVPVGNVFSFVY